MIEPWLEVLRPRVRGERALDAVREIARHHRIQASPGYDDAARWLAGTLADEGFDVRIEEVAADGRSAYLGCVMPEGWSARTATADLVAAGTRERIADFASEPLSLVQRSAPARGTYPLVALADGTEREHYEGVDVRGRVVLTEGAVQRVHQLAVVERGAAGLLAYGRRLVPPARTREHDRDSLAYTSFWWGGDEPRGWGFVASPARGEALAARLARGEPLSLDVTIESRRFATQVPLVTATLPGEWPGEVLLTAHLCHPKPGANDNASGVAAALEALRALGALADAGHLPRSRRTIRVLWMPELTGTYAWLAGAEARASSTIAALNLDMVGEDQAACGSEQLLERAPHFAASFADELARLVRHATRPPHDPARDGELRAREVPYSGGSDHAIWIDPAIGVPCPMLIQWPDRFYHSNLDAPNRCDPRALAHAALFAATYAAGLAAADATSLAWMASRIERAAQRDLRAALEAPEPRRAVRVARRRAHLALASLGRFVPGAPDAEAARETLARELVAATEAIEGTVDAEIAPALAGQLPEPARERRCPRVPVRRQHAPLAAMRSLQAGWLAVEDGVREAWRAMERDVPGGSTTLELAWMACDGSRSVDAIAACLADEGTDVDAAVLERFFDGAVALGAADWRDAREG